MALGSPEEIALNVDNYAARVAKYGQAQVDAMEAAGRRFGGRMGAVPPTTPAAPVAPAAPTTALGRMAAELPTMGRFVRGADGVLRAVGGASARALPVVGGALAVAGEAAGVAEKVADPFATGADVATRAAEGVGRMGSMAAGAGLGGLAAGPLGAIAGGTAGYFAPNAIYAARDWWQNRGAKPTTAPDTAPAVLPRVMGPGAVPGSQSQVRAVDNSLEAPLYPNGAPVTAMTPADVRGSTIPASGTGAIMNSRTGVVTNLDSRGAEPEPAAPRTGRTANGLPDVGGFFGATAHLRQIAQDNALKTARAKMQLEYGNKAAQGAHYEAQATNENLRTAAAAAHLRAYPGDFAMAASIASGRIQPPDQKVFLPTMDQGKVDVGDRRSGAIERVSVQPRPTENDILADMKAINKATKKPYTREEVIAAYRARGINVGYGATR
jgi:hypothetical protein